MGRMGENEKVGKRIDIYFGLMQALNFAFNLSSKEKTRNAQPY